jgi:uncharacterized OsmC-like protein
VSDTKPSPSPEPLVLDLEWLGENRLRGRSGGVEIVMDSPPVAGPSPVQALAFGLAGCMAIDVIVKVDLRYTITGDVPADRVQRAIDLSRDKYCSVWHSMRPDIELTTSFEVVRP